LPTEANAESDSAGRAFVRHYFAAISYALKSGDTEPMIDVSGVDCQSCTSIADLVDGVYDKGGRYETPGWEVERIVAAPRPGNDRRLYLLKIREARRSLLDSQGKVVDVNPASTMTMRMIIGRRESSWFTARLDVVR
jgi:hypothetical protein